MKIGLIQGFMDGKNFYLATEKGFKSFDEYTKCTNAGYNNRTDFQDSRKMGFDHFNKEEFSREYPYSSYYSSSVSESEMYYKAKTMEYRNYQDFVEGYTNGFENALQYLEAKKKGFTKKSDYTIAIERGFTSYTDYKTATDLMISSVKEYQLYQSYLKMISEFDTTNFEEIHFLMIIKNISPGQNISGTKLWNLLIQEQNNFRAKQTKWYTICFKNESEMRMYLNVNNKTKKFGIYDKDGDVFVRSKEILFSKDIIVIDGSNVAWNEGDRKKGDKPIAQNIMLVIDELHEMKFNKIVVIVDANLKYEIDDKKVLNQIKKLCTYEEVPANTDADEFIITYAKKKNAKIITRDKFNDIKQKDEWVRDNIGKYRIRYKISGDVVKLYDVLN
jgi:hypothetical protein